MAYQWATWLADALRAAGCQVVEHAGWQTRGLSGGTFTPRAVVWHHDASPPGDSPSVPLYLIKNYSTASAQTWVDRAGTWHLIGAGRAPHAGVVLSGKPGNSTSIGVETDHTTGEPWPAAQMLGLRRGTAAILARLGVQASPGLEFHKTICDPPGRKVDPAGLDLAMERVAVQAMKDGQGTDEEDDMPLTIAEMDQIADRVWAKMLGPVAGLGPAPAQTWLMDTRVAASAPPPPPPPGAAGALSDADVARIAKAVNDDAAGRLTD